MPKWILSTKRRRSKEEEMEPVDLKKHKEKALEKGARRGGACSSSESGYSMSPVGSSQSSEPDPGDLALDLVSCRASCNGPVNASSTSEESEKEPLDLSLKDHRGRNRTGESGTSRDQKSTDMSLLLEVKTICDAVLGAKGHLGSISPLSSNAQQIKQELYDDNLRYHHHHHHPYQQQQQHPGLGDQHPLKGTTTVDPRSKGKPQTTRKRHLSIDGGCEDEGHVTEALVTPEAVARLERIENKIGGYDCKLCANGYANAFDLANHNCSGIVKVEHRCPECGKVFQCPANLASHRRWHGLRVSNREPTWAAVASLPESKEQST